MAGCECNDFRRWYQDAEIYFNRIYKRWEITANWPIYFCPFCGDALAALLAGEGKSEEAEREGGAGRDALEGVE